MFIVFVSAFFVMLPSVIVFVTRLGSLLGVVLLKFDFGRLIADFESQELEECEYFMFLSRTRCQIFISMV